MTPGTQSKIIHVSHAFRWREGLFSFVSSFMRLPLGSEQSLFPHDYLRQKSLDGYSLVYMVRLCSLVFRHLKNTVFVVHTFPAVFYFCVLKVVSFGRLHFICVEHRSSTNRRKYFFFRAIDLLIYSFADATVCVSNYSRKTLLHWLTGNDSLSEKFGFLGRHLSKLLRDRVLVVAPPLGFAARPSSSLPEIDARTLCFVGRLEKEKDPGMVLAMYERLKSRLNKVVFIGDGGLRSELEKRAQELTAGGGAVHFLGSQESPWEVAPSGAIVVIPSKTEGFCLVAAEAFARGHPVIASSIEALGELVEGRGFLAQSEDVESFVHAWESLESDLGYAARMRNDAHQFVSKNLSDSEISRMYSNILSRVSH